MESLFAVGCETTLNDLKGFATDTGFQISCTNSCKGTTVPVYGHANYSAESSLCKAAEQMNAFVTTPSGTKISIINVSGFDNLFKSGAANGVISESKKYVSNVPKFSPNKFSTMCPMEVYENSKVKNAFIQTSQYFNTKKNKNMRKDINHFGKSFYN